MQNFREVARTANFFFFKTPEVLQSYAGFLAPTWHALNVPRFLVPPLNGFAAPWGVGERDR